MTPDSINPAQTVNAVLAQHPSAGTVFNDFGIDMCCGGDLSLTDAARREGVELAVLLDALAKATDTAAVPR